MTEPKFTPGPWHTEINWKPYVAQGNGIVLAEALDNSVINRNEAEANAALIAAAPEMYDALYSVCVACKMRDHETECKLCTVEAALRKARGEEESK